MRSLPRRQQDHLSLFQAHQVSGLARSAVYPFVSLLQKSTRVFTGLTNAHPSRKFGCCAHAAVAVEMPTFKVNYVTSGTV